MEAFPSCVKYDGSGWLDRNSRVFGRYVQGRRQASQGRDDTFASLTGQQTAPIRDERGLAEGIKGNHGWSPFTLRDCRLYYL